MNAIEFQMNSIILVKRNRKTDSGTVGTYYLTIQVTSGLGWGVEENYKHPGLSLVGLFYVQDIQNNLQTILALL